MVWEPLPEVHGTKLHCTKGHLGERTVSEGLQNRVEFPHRGESNTSVCLPDFLVYTAALLAVCDRSESKEGAFRAPLNELRDWVYWFK